MPKINVANPATCQQKVFDIEDEHKIMPFWEKRMGSELDAKSLGDEWKGYIVRIAGGNDKQGFPMKQGILQDRRVRLLFKKGMSCYKERRNGCRKRKSVRGCIVGHDLAMLALVITKKGDADIPGLTDGAAVKRLGPKRASKIRAMWGLGKEDNVKDYVIHRKTKEDSKNTKACKIQRLVTKSRIQRKRRVKNTISQKVIKSRAAQAAYTKKVHDHTVAMKEKRSSELAKKKKGKKVEA